MGGLVSILGGLEDGVLGGKRGNIRIIYQVNSSMLRWTVMVVSVGQPD
jgi:hypothetical protein